MKRIVVDLDGTITLGNTADYDAVLPNTELIVRLKEYKVNGFEIVIATARNMRTHGGNIGKINVFTLPKIIDWLDRYDVPYDEIIVGKPWCGFDGFYVDDRAIRPSEFKSLSYEKITALINEEKHCF